MTEGNARRNLDAEICPPFPFGSLGRAAGIALARLRSLSLASLKMTAVLADFYAGFALLLILAYSHVNLKKYGKII